MRGKFKIFKYGFQLRRPSFFFYSRSYMRKNLKALFLRAFRGGFRIIPYLSIVNKYVLSLSRKIERLYEFWEGFLRSWQWGLALKSKNARFPPKWSFINMTVEYENISRDIFQAWACSELKKRKPVLLPCVVRTKI